MFRSFSVIFFVLFFASAAKAEQSPYHEFLKRESPAELHYLAQGGIQCMIQRSQLSGVVREEFLKQRIRPVIVSPNHDYLYAKLDCALHSADPLVFAYRIGVRFIDSSAVQPEAYYEEYSKLGISSDPEFVIGEFRKSVNEAVLDYVEANLSEF